jgi:hypothetical protein
MMASWFERAAAVFLGALLLFSLSTTWIQVPWHVHATWVGIFTLAAAFAIRSLFSRHRPLGLSWIAVPLIGMALWGVLQIAFGVTVYRFATRSAVLSWLAALGLLIASLEIFAVSSLRHAFRRAIVIAVFLASIEAIAQLITSPSRVFWMFEDPQYTSPVGPFLNHNHWAALVELGLPLAVWQVLERRHVIFNVVASAIMFASVVAGASRAGTALVLGEVIALALMTVAGRGGSRPRALRIGAMLAMCAVFAGIVGPETVINRFGRAWEDEPFRAQMTQLAVKMALARPLLGFGLGTWTKAYPGYVTFDAGVEINHAHNDWAEWAAEGGLPFVAMLAALAALSIRLVLQCPWGIGVIAVYLHSFVDYPLQKPPILFASMTLLAMMQMSVVSRRRSAPKHTVITVCG